jgi:hypothetical protein
MRSFNKRFRDNKNIKLKAGKIYENGELIGSYRILSIDGAPWSRALIQAGDRPYEKAALVFTDTSVAGGVLATVIIPAGSFTTLGLTSGAASTSATVAQGSLASSTIQQLNAVIRGTQQQLLRELFKGQTSGAAGARQALANLKIPPGLTREALLVYYEIARRYVEAGRDTTGVQAVRLKIIEEALKILK